MGPVEAGRIPVIVATPTRFGGWDARETADGSGRRSIGEAAAVCAVDRAGGREFVGASVGINRKTGCRWRYGRSVRNAAGEVLHYAPVKITPAKPRSPRYLSEDERIVIADLLRAGQTVRAIALELGRSPSTVSREIRRNSDAHARYRPTHAEQARESPRSQTSEAAGRGRCGAAGGRRAAVGQAVEPGAGGARAQGLVRRPAGALSVHRVDLSGDLRPGR